MKNIFREELLLFITIISLLGIGCEKTKESEPTKLSGPFFGLVPTQKPQILAPALISEVLTEYNGTFSPDGKEFFYTSEVGGKGNIVYTRLQDNNQWTTPEIAPFSGEYSEYDPIFSPDGSRLYFSSQRPVDSDKNRKYPNIWLVEKTSSGWGEPQFIFLSGEGDYYSSINRKGEIYYNIWNTGKILKASPTDTGYVSVELPETINERSDVGDPFISPNGDYLIYRAYYKEGYGRGDLYISFNHQGKWTEAQNLGEPINSNAHEICPYVTTDGKLFIFSSDRLEQDFKRENLGQLQEKYKSYDNGQSNIYYMSADFIEKFRATSK